MNKHFFVFEGGDSTGKTTQIRLLEDYLRRVQERPVLVLQEPGGTPLGLAVRSILLEPLSGDLDATTEVFLFMAARSHLVRTRLRPALEEGAVVICDRFLWSSVVYQGVVGGLGIETVLELGRLAVDDVMPTRTFVLDLGVATAAQRASGRGDADRIERKGAEFQDRVRGGFLDLARRFPDSTAVIDAAGGPEEVHARVVAQLPGGLLEKGETTQ